METILDLNEIHHLEQKEQHDAWLEEFLDSEAAANLSEYQRAQLDRMLLQLFSMAYLKEPPTEWTGEIVVTIAQRVCGCFPEPDDYYAAFPDAVAAYFQFLGAKGYHANGTAIGQQLLEDRATIKQSEEERYKLEKITKIIERALEEGIDVNDKEAFGAYLEQIAKEKEVIHTFFEKKNAGMPIYDIMEGLSEQEREVVFRDMMEHTELPEGEMDLKKAMEGLEIIQTAMAQGKRLDEASQLIPESILPHVLRLMQADMEGTLPLPAYRKPITPIARTGKKVGRNAPCPCGSGKKYKKCCLKKG